MLDALYVAVSSIRILRAVHKKNLIQLPNKKYLRTLEVEDIGSDVTPQFPVFKRPDNNQRCYYIV